MIPINVNLPLKSVSGRVRSCHDVLGAIETFGDQMSGTLGEDFAPFLPEGQVMPFQATLELFAGRLSASSQRMVETDRAYRDQRTRETLFRGRRDDAASEVNDDVVGLRKAFGGIYREEKLAEVGFARRTPQSPGELLEQATHLATRLQDPTLDLTGSRFGDLQLEAAKLAAKLVASVASLEQASTALSRQERRTEARKLAKDEALEAHNSGFLWIARTVESLCRLAGLDEVAKRIRPSTRRPGLIERQAEPGEGGEAGSEEQTSPSGEATPTPEQGSPAGGSEIPASQGEAPAAS